MTAVPISSSGDGSVRDRLIRAADAEITEGGIDTIQMESIALRAGVSRATAFRQLGNISEMLLQVALLRGRRYVDAAEALMATKTGVFTKIEAALLYTTRHLPTDPSMSALVAQRSTAVHNPRVHQMAVEALGPVLIEGQCNGEVRSDLTIDELVDFVVEQMYITAEEIDRSDASVRRRFRNFILPALAASGRAPNRLSLATEAEDAVAVAIDALTNLAGELERGRRP